MENEAKRAVNLYIQAASELNPATRAALLEACFAENGRMITRSREIHGRAAISEMISRFWADPQSLRIRLITEVDAMGKMFRFGSVVECRDGSVLHNFDAGEIDTDGRISLILAFAGPLGGVVS